LLSVDETLVGRQRQQLRQGRCAMLPDVLAPEAAAPLRARIQFEPFFIADRGRYHQSAAADAVLDPLRALAEELAEAALEPAPHQFLRLERGDYQLVRDDSVRRVPGRHLELLLDFSEAPTGQAEIIYSHGLTLSQVPLSVALVERDDSQYRYQRYLNHKVGDARVFRLRLPLRFTR
jgi:hypothetical protein